MKRFLKLIRAAPVFLFLLLALLAACGGGSGGSSSSTVSSSTPTNQMAVNFDSYANEAGNDGIDYVPNTPYVTVYIVNASGVQMPFNLLLDTGSTGVLINESALQAAGVTLPGSGQTFCGQFGDQTMFGGYVWSSPGVEISSGGLSTGSGFQVAVNQDTDPNNNNYTCPGTSGGPAAYPSNGFLQGEVGMGLSPFLTFGSSQTAPPTPSLLPTGYTNGFMLEFTPVSVTTGYSSSGSGTITFGLNTGSNNSTAGYSFFPSDSTLSPGSSYPVLDAEFGGIINDPDYDSNPNYISQNYTALFDTGSTYIYMDDVAMENASGIANIVNDEYDIPSFGNMVDGGLFMNMGFYNGAGSGISSKASYDGRVAFITSPNSLPNIQFPSSLLTSVPPDDGYLLFVNTIMDIGSEYGQEVMGMPYLFNYPMYWQAPTDQQTGEGWGIGINFSP